MLSLSALTVFAADGGARADAGVAKPKAARDAGPTDAGATLGPGEWKAKPILVLAEDETVIDKYALAKPADRAAIKGVLTKVTIGRRTAGAILLEGYELPYSRRVDISADLVITDPEGKEMIDKASVSGAQTMDPKLMVLLPLKPLFGLMFGLTDREGEYKVRITVWDHIRGASTKLETSFVVTR